MAVTVTPITDAATSPYKRVFEIAATADADVLATITTGMTVGGIVPAAGPNVDAALQIIIEPLQTQFYLSLWCVTSRVAAGNTQVTLSKANAAGSGVAGTQIRVTIMRALVYGW